jgi:hypothetical protein
MAQVGYGILVKREKFYNIVANYYGITLPRLALDQYEKMDPQVIEEIEEGLERSRLVNIARVDPLRFFGITGNDAIPELNGLVTLDKVEMIFVGSKSTLFQNIMKPVDEMFSDSYLRHTEDSLVKYGFGDYLPTYYIGSDLWLDQLILRNKNEKLL